MDKTMSKKCPECGGPLSGTPHMKKACIKILRSKLEESEQERRVAEGDVRWLSSQLESRKAHA